MSDESENLPLDKKVAGDSPLAKVWFNVVGAIRFVAANADRELASKVAAVVIALCYSVAVAIHEWALAPMAAIAVMLIVPLGLIWFPEEIGSISGYIGKGQTISETPPGLVSFMGWLILIIVGVAFGAIALGY
jgi:hypothetical protein